MRRIVYVTGTRADFGLMRRTLDAIHAERALELSLLVTGMHLSPHFGTTVDLIVESGLPIASRVDMLLSADSGAAMGTGVGLGVIGMIQALREAPPDVLLVLGDRGEMLAGAIAAIHLNVPIAHIHGGELSGTIDEAVRHAVSKLSHIHFATTERSAQRLQQLGEAPERVHVVGAPGLDDVLDQRAADQASLAPKYGIPKSGPYLLVVQHPVHQELAQSERQMDETLAAVLESGLPAVVSQSNADAGHEGIAKAIRRRLTDPGYPVYPNIPRTDYIDLLRHAHALVGNSSSGIIEAASLGVPVVNVGSRQRARERNPNTIDVGHDRRAILEAIRRAGSDEAFRRVVAQRHNVYGDGHATRRIVDVLKAADIGPQILTKSFFE